MEVRSSTLGAWSGGGRPLLNRLPAFRDHLTLSVAPRQARRYAGTVRDFLWQSHVVHPCQLTEPAIETYLRRLGENGMCPRTVRNHLTPIRAFCRWLVKQGVLTINPAEDIRTRKPERLPPHYLSDGEIGVALDIARRCGIYDAVMLGMTTMLRVNELRLLEWADVHLASCELLVRHTKSRQFRTVPLCADGVAALLDLWDGRGNRYVFAGGKRREGSQQPRGLRWWFGVFKPLQDLPTYGRIAKGSTGRAWHTLRHTGATRLSQANVSPVKIAEWLGHSNLETVMVYAHVAPGHDAQIECLSIPPPRPGRDGNAENPGHEGE